MKNELSLKELLEKKKLKIKTNEELEKLHVILELFKENDWAFRLNMQTVFGILEFLEVPEHEVMSVYNELISFKNFQESNKEVVFVEPNRGGLK